MCWENWKSCSLRSHPEWNKSVELLLGSSDRAERFAQLFAREWRQLVGPNEVVGRAALANLPGVVIEPDLPDKGKGFQERLRGFLVERPQLSAAISRSRVGEMVMPFDRA